jgi:hypothetical protein
MKPRTAPKQAIESAEAKMELVKYADPDEVPELAKVVVFWQETARPSGLPERWRADEPPQTDAGGAVWRVYLKILGGFYMGFAESLSGEVLRLLLIIPIEDLTQIEALAELRKRV